MAGFHVTANLNIDWLHQERGESIMKQTLSILCLLTAAFLAFGCSQNDVVQPEGTQVADVGLDKGAASNAQPRFHTMHWPPPYYAPGVMKLDKNTGEGTHVTDLDIALAPPGWPGEYPGFVTPYGIAFDVDGTAYSLNNWFDGVPEDCFSQLIKMDLETGATWPIGPVHDINFAGPEFDACGNLWATGFTVGPPEGGPIYVWGDSYLYRIDKNTGEKTQIGDTGHTEWMDLDFDSDGRLWGTFGNDLYIIDTETGASEFITHVDGVEDNRIPGVCEEDWEYMEIMGIAFDHRDVLWATAMKGFSYCEEGGLAVPVMTVDIDAGTATLVGSSILDGQSHGGDIPPKTVNVCHRQENGSYKSIEVSLSALAAHLAHGDMLPQADGNGCGCPQGGRSARK